MSTFNKPGTFLGFGITVVFFYRIITGMKGFLKKYFPLHSTAGYEVSPVI